MSRPPIDLTPEQELAFGEVMRRAGYDLTTMLPLDRDFARACFQAGWDTRVFTTPPDAGDRLATLEEVLGAEFQGVRPEHAAKVLARLEGAGFVLMRRPR